MTCKEFIEFLLEYFEDDLAQERREVFEEHMEICPDCVAYLDSYRQTVSMLEESSKSGSEEVGEEVPRSLIDAILAAQPK